MLAFTDERLLRPEYPQYADPYSGENEAVRVAVDRPPIVNRGVRILAMDGGGMKVQIMLSESSIEGSIIYARVHRRKRPPWSIPACLPMAFCCRAWPSSDSCVSWRSELAVVSMSSSISSAAHRQAASWLSHWP